MHAAAFRELNLGRSRRGETKPPKTKNGMAQPFSWKPPLPLSSSLFPAFVLVAPTACQAPPHGTAARDQRPKRSLVPKSKVLTGEAVTELVRQICFSGISAIQGGNTSA